MGYGIEEGQGRSGYYSRKENRYDGITGVDGHGKAQAIHVVCSLGNSGNAVSFSLSHQGGTVILLECDKLTLDDGTIITIGKKFDRPRDIVRAIILACYEEQKKKDQSIASAQMQTAVLLKYETTSMIRKSLDIPA